ncbi:regulator of sigma-W protease RasP [Lachnospiraceae bacterium]|nr:RIP metalloprotease RseP [Eubacterium sp.]GFI27712.1 regulator of sigma-W protease RasP [Lachnospiraceae bacterium]
MKFIIAILMFSIIILFHELGHFLLAKKNGIRVNEFCLGLGPTLFGVTKGETKYSVKLFPFGGACMMEGEDGESEDQKAFGQKSVWARISVVAAGPVFNFIMAFVFAVILLSCIGIDRPVVSETINGYSAQAAGMQKGDVIVKINQKKIHFYREVSMYTFFYPGETLEVTYQRNGEEKTAVIEPKLDEKSGRYMIGIKAQAQRERGGLLTNLKYGAHEVGYWIWTSLQSLKMLVTGKVSLNELSGPVGIVKTIGDTYDASKQDGIFYIFLSMLNFSILLSANLGVMNLLPLPALDGGRLIFLILEAVRKKRVDPEKEGMVHFVGIMILMGLMVLVMFNDIRKLFI